MINVPLRPIERNEIHMKKITLFMAMLAILLVMSACGNASANLPSLPNPTTTAPKVDPCKDGHTYTNEAQLCDVCGADYFSENLDFTLSVTRDSYILSGLGTCERTVVYIPSTHKGKPVTEIAGTAFNAVTNPACEAITEIVLPDSIVSIQSNAFFKCIGLKKITLNEGISFMGSDVLRGCTALESLRLPSTMTYVPSGVLQYCSGIKSVEIAGPATIVNSYAFYDCSSLESISLPDTVTEVMAGAFSGCTSLRNIRMSAAIQTIGRGVFDNCTSLEYNVHGGIAYLGNENMPYVLLVKINDNDQTEFVIHDDTRAMNYNAFAGSNVKSLTIGKNLTVIPHAGLNDLTQLEYISVSEGNPVYHSSNNCLIETAAKKIIRGTKNSVIPTDGSVIEIGSFSFAHLQGLTSIVIPAPIERLGGSAFSNCSDLEYAVLPNTLNHIELSIFAYCDKFATVYFDGNNTEWMRIRNIIPVSAGGGGMSFGDNHILLDATYYTYSEEQPTMKGKYWHYVDGKITAWEEIV